MLGVVKVVASRWNEFEPFEFFWYLETCIIQSDS